MKNLFTKKWTKTILFFSVLTIVALAFKTQILRGAGDFLIKEDPESFAPITFVLGGNSYDRGMKALDLFNKHLTDKIVCSGGNIPSVLEAFDTTLYEAEITKILLQKNGVSDVNLAILTNSTSTIEESEEILLYCLENNITQANLVSSKFHLRRVRNVFEDKFESKGVSLQFVGAPSSKYNELEWWKSEEGMIMVNNEYMKLLYYFIRK